MKRLFSALALSVLVLPASAADRPEAPLIYSKLRPKVGAWAEYAFTKKNGDDVKTQGTLRLSVVGKDGDNIWLEQKFEITKPEPKKGQQGPMISKMLVGKEGIQKMFVKTGPMVMDMSGMMGMAAKKKQAAADKVQPKEVGVETITVPAGDFKSTHYNFENEKKENGDTWIKEGVGPYGLIKQVYKSTNGKNTMTLELTSSGSDAKSELDETQAKGMFGGMGGGSSAAGSSDSGQSAAPSMGDLMKGMMRRKTGGN